MPHMYLLVYSTAHQAGCADPLLLLPREIVLSAVQVVYLPRRLPPPHSQPTAYDSHAPQPTVSPSRGLRATGGQHAAAHTTAHSGADAHGSRGLALGGGSRADRRRAAAAHARTRASGRTPVRLCLLRHRLQPPSCPPRPELEAKPPQLAVDLLPVRRRAAPRVHTGELDK